MSKTVRILLGTLLAVVLLIVAGGAWLWRAVHRTPEFYEAAVHVDPSQQKKKSDDMLRRSAAVISDVKRKKPWEALFTTDEINGWLAVDLVENYPRLLPSELQEPRVAIHPHEIVVGCKYDGPQLSTVVSIDADVTLEEPDVLAVRIRKARAGDLPLPLGKLLPQAIAGLKSAGFSVEERKIDGDPLLLVTLPNRIKNTDQAVPVLEKVELREGEVYIAGEAKK